MGINRLLLVHGLLLVCWLLGIGRLLRISLLGGLLIIALLRLRLLCAGLLIIILLIGLLLIISLFRRRGLEGIDLAGGSLLLVGGLIARDLRSGMLIVSVPGLLPWRLGTIEPVIIGIFDFAKLRA